MAIPPSTSSSSSSMSGMLGRHRATPSIQQRSSSRGEVAASPVPPTPSSSTSVAFNLDAPSSSNPPTPSSSGSNANTNSGSGSGSGYTSLDEEDGDEEDGRRRAHPYPSSSRLILEPSDTPLDNTFDLGSEGDEYDDDRDIEDANAPFIPHRNRRSSRHDKRPSLSSASSSSSGPLTLFHLTLNLLNTSLSPTILALPFTVALLSPALFIPLTVILGFLAAASHVSIVYIARYLGVKRYEDLGKGLGGGKLFRAVLRVLMVLAGIGILVLYLRMMGNLLVPIASANFTSAASIVQHRSFWIIIMALITFPLLLPFHLHSPTITRLSLLATLSPIFLTVIIIVKTIALHRNGLAIEPATPLAGTDFGAVVAGNGLGRGGIWGGITIVTFLLTSHLSTLPSHSTLLKSSQRQFALSPLLQSLVTLALILPLSLLPYFLLAPSLTSPNPTPPLPPNILDAFPTKGDGWVVCARLAAVGMCVSGAPMVFLPTREVLARGLGMKGGGLGGGGGAGMGGGRRGKEFWILTGVLWGFSVGLACCPNDYWVGEKVVLLGVAGTLGLSYVLPAILFITLFHLRRPLSIIFPSSTHTNPQPTNPSSPPGTPSTSPNPFAPSPSQIMDALLAKKERQLQKRRTGRRIWQDAVVFFGVLPMGVICWVWSVGRVFGVGGVGS